MTRSSQEIEPPSDPERFIPSLFELADAILCSNGLARSLAELSLVGEHRRGHGGLYATVVDGRLDTGRLQRALAAVSLPRAADGQLVLRRV
jgi:hypothetical protein